MSKRNRASRQEMYQREAAATELIRNSNGTPVTTLDIGKHLGLSRQGAANLARSMIQRGEWTTAGREGRTLHFQVTGDTPVTEPVTNGHTVQTVERPKVAEAVQQEETHEATERDLAPVKFENILEQLHLGLGSALKVRGFHVVEGKMPTVDLESDGVKFRAIVETIE